ncbi:uncharacterized protein LOC121799708 [Salvia splendens]|uniref:uncharacterized protein LOC121799708 n=1 Tax=Salvia splendens TaxID=180675 RepID=UPI001C279AB9|nr:uncharacterized protein LOC121799708 [Salvia splendens]
MVVECGSLITPQYVLQRNKKVIQFKNRFFSSSHPFNPHRNLGNEVRKRDESKTDADLKMNKRFPHSLKKLYVYPSPELELEEIMPKIGSLPNPTVGMFRERVVLPDSSNTTLFLSLNRFVASKLARGKQLKVNSKVSRVSNWRGVKI